MPAATLRVLANGGFSFLPLLFVEPHQIGIGHVDLAADFQQRRRIVGRAAAKGCREWCGRCG